MVFKITSMQYYNGTISYSEEYTSDFDDVSSSISRVLQFSIGESITGSWCQGYPTHKIIMDSNKYYCYSMYDLQGTYCNVDIVPEAKEAVYKELRCGDENFKEKYELIKAINKKYKDKNKKEYITNEKGQILIMVSDDNHIIDDVNIVDFWWTIRSKAWDDYNTIAKVYAGIFNKSLDKKICHDMLRNQFVWVDKNKEFFVYREHHDDELYVIYMDEIKTHKVEC